MALSQKTDTDKVKEKKRRCIIFCEEVAWFFSLLSVLSLLYFFYFLSTFGKNNLTHLTTNVMFSGQCFAILAMFFFWEVEWFCLLRGCMIFVCGEVVWFFSLSHSGCMIYFSGGCLIFFLRGDCVIFWSNFFCGELAWYLFCGEAAWFFLWTGCVISYA